MTLLDVRGLVHNFGTPAGTLHAVRGVDFTVEASETVALVGESGSGKSTTARAVTRLLQPTAGRVLVEGEDLITADRRRTKALRKTIQMVFQDPYSSLDPRRTVAQSIMEPLNVHAVGSRADRERRVRELLALVGLDNDRGAVRPGVLSGGQRQRVAIARALALEPRIVVCDEAVSALDVSVQAQVLNLLLDLQQRLGVGYLFITHDLAVVSEIADRVAVMYLGRIVEAGSRSNILGSPQHPYTQALLSAAPHIAGGAERIVLQGEVPSALQPPTGCAFRSRCPRASTKCAVDDPSLLVLDTVGRTRSVGDPDPDRHAVACHHPGPDAFAGAQ